MLNASLSLRYSFGLKGTVPWKTELREKFSPTIWASPPGIGIRQSYSQPEKELMLAVLKDALLTYKKCIYSGNALFKEAETWLFEREPDRLYAFETVCAVLGLSAEKLRHNLLAWKLNALSDLARGRHLGADRMAS
jgi:hypothetical protein